MRFDLALRVCKFIGEFCQHIAIDQNALMPHGFEHGNQRTLQSFIDCDFMFLEQPWFQQLPQAQRHVRIFRRIGRGPVQSHLCKRDCGLSGTRDFLETDGFVAQMLLRHFVHAVAILAGFHGIGNQHGVIDGADIVP